ncbi:MAG: hypothetical protein WC761_00445 [Candidatus Paceibacterota bacterium]|jgi:hypothetical protein
MAIISIEAGPISPTDTNAAGTYYYNSHTLAAQDFSIVTPAASAATTSAIYRGRLAGNYVYSTGTPPGGGATDIVIIGYI